MAGGHVLITGATSGIGLGLLGHYHARPGWEVTAVNRRTARDVEDRFPHAEFHHFDVRNRDAVRAYFAEAAATGRLPSVLLLSAGINRVDAPAGQLALDVFREVMEVNLLGAMNFVEAALPHYRGRRAVVVGVSSTSNMFPNPNCLGYYASKLTLHRVFKLLDRAHRGHGIRFKTMVLGPIATNIFVGGTLGSRLQATVRDLIMVTVDKAVPTLAAFVESGRRVLYYPLPICGLYCALRLANAVVPGFYKGSVPAQPGGATEGSL